MTDCDCKLEAKNNDQRKTLYLLFSLNLMMFFGEVIGGVIAQSTALVADSLDMLADAIVYGISLYAVSRSQLHKQRAAFLSGIFQITLALFVLIDVVKKIILGSNPEFVLMSGMGMIALAVNIYCLFLIAKYKHDEVHMRASWIFSKNDVLANLAVIFAGLMVKIFNSPLPDLLVGSGIVLLILGGGITIIRESRHGIKS